MKIRIKFAKYGSMKFIGHLDVMRFFQKAIRRADIDIKYSEGFNPHQIMSFAAPLGVGIESRGEYLDIEVNTLISTQKMKDDLNKVMIEGMEILSVTVLPDAAQNAMASVAAAKYRVVCHADGVPAYELPDKLAAFYNREHIFVTKTTKKSVLELDLKPGIHELTLTMEPDSSFAITMLVDASSSGNIKPVMVLDAFWNYARIAPSSCSYQITRIDTYTNPAKETQTPKFVPLEAVGHSYA
ncbi:MAG: TIGR03936 family radical SAM-associated protein [Bacillus sp. (in: Bacteria)]|nr:TIGR03936 family radical SAM-associated protein [Bacillus sp. (in: firmicutes)]MCM1425904.1 TIGR03936 family radical SAM-associated protein [Eubacterium sp.]